MDNLMIQMDNLMAQEEDVINDFRSAVVMQAVEDYKAAYDAMMKAKARFNECECFFKSKAFELYNTTNFSGMEILEELNDQLTGKKKRVRKSNKRFAKNKKKEIA